MYKLSEFSMPILAVADEGILSKTGDFTVCFELIRPPLFSLSAAKYEAMHQSWIKALRVFASGIILHMQDIYFERKWKPEWTSNYLGEASNRHFDERPYLNNTCYCFITLRNPDRKPSNSGLSTLLKGSIVPEFVHQPKLLKPFLDQCKQFQSILTDSGLVQLRSLSTEELIGHDGNHGIIGGYFGLTPFDNEAALGDVAFEEDMVIDGQACALYTLSDADDLPAEVRPCTRYGPYSTAATEFPVGFATGLGPLLDVPHLYNQYIFLDDPVKMLADLESRRRRLKSLSGQSRDNTLACDTIGQFLEEAAVSQRLPVRAHFNVIAWSTAPEKLEEIKRKICTRITPMGIIPRHETIGAPQIWWAGIPGNAGEFPMNDTFETFAEQATCFLISETNERSRTARSVADRFGLRLGDRHSGVPLHVDISDEPMRLQQISNRNKFVLGGSGSGKSVFINHLTRQYYDSDAHIVVVDIGGSYQGLCQLLGGTYFTYSEKDPLCFNPFRLESGDGWDTEKRESIKTLLFALWKKSDEPFRRSEYVALSNALKGYYHVLQKNRNAAACFNSFYEFLRDSFRQQLAKDKVKREDFDLDNLLYVLRPFYKGGEYDYLLNAVDQPSLLDERLIVFELDAVKDHPILFPVVTIIIMEVFISKMRKLHGRRKVIIIEEAWKAIANQGMSEYIKYLFKTVRKHYGEAIVVTQDVEDIVSSPIVKNAIINNADCKIVLDQSKFLHRFDQIQELLGLTNEDKTMVLSLNKANDPERKYKEVFIGMANGPSKIYRTELSLEEYLTYTTEESEKVVVREYTEKNGNIRRGISAMAKDIRQGMIKLLVIAGLAGLFLLIPNGRASAQVLEVVELINAAVKKVIVAADLQVQRLQTQTIALQDAEKALENSMAGGLLDDITGWVQDQEDLYGGYYQELWQVKSALSTYSKTATLIQRQLELVKEEQQDWGAVQQDSHFSLAELGHIGNVYSGILNESSRNVQQIALVIKAFVTQMDDAGRLQLIDETNKGIDLNYQDLRQFTQENTLLSMQRAKDQADLLTIQALYNLP